MNIVALTLILFLSGMVFCIGFAFGADGIVRMVQKQRPRKIIVICEQFSCTKQRKQGTLWCKKHQIATLSGRKQCRP